MPKFFTSGAYQPEDYSIDDYLRYQYLLQQTKQSITFGSAKTVSSVKSVPLFKKTEEQLKVLNVYRERFLSLSETEASVSRNKQLTQQLIDRVMAHAERRLGINYDSIITSSLTDSFSAECSEDTEFGLIFLQILQELDFTIEFMQQNDSYQTRDDVIRDPGELAPTAKSLLNLRVAWIRVLPETVPFGFTDIRSAAQELGACQRDANRFNISPDIVQAHMQNLRMVTDGAYESECAREFACPQATFTMISQPDIYFFPDAQTAPIARGSAASSVSNPGFLLSIYNDPSFKNGWLQLLLLAIILTAVLAAAAFMVNSAVLPLAVSGVVTGLSKVAANLFFGTALTVAAAATVTLTASLHARFFAKPDDNGGGAGYAMGFSSTSPNFGNL